jgi:ribosomal protein L29
MALKLREMRSMDVKTRMGKINELKMELIKSYVSAQKNKIKTKEVKKAIARLVTLNKNDKKHAKK